MIRLFVIAALVLWPSLAMAKIYTVRSGEHADFSRIVILSTDLPGWTLGRVEGGYEMRPEDSSTDYNLRTVFEMIPKDRISSIDKRSDGRLFLAVNCRCFADAFEIPAGLVIDIKDGIPGENAGFETALAPRPDDNPTKPTSVGAIAAIQNPVKPPTVLGDLAQRFVQRRTDLAWQTELAVEFPITSAPKPTANPIPKPEHALETNAPTIEPDRAANLRDALVEQLGRAAAQGLVTVDLAETEARVAKTTPESHELALNSENSPETAEINEMITGPNVRIETAVDRGSKPRANRSAMTPDGGSCRLSDDFDIVNWGTASENGEPLSLSRSSILGEFDEANPASIEALVKHYIYLTFGAEAKALVAAFETDIRNKDVLLTLADIMDFGVTHSTVLGKDQMACDTNVAMWAVLSAPSLSRGDSINREAIISAFTELPLHLRRHLGRYLAERFLQIDDTDTASVIRDAIARAPGDHGESFEMMDAQISLETGDETRGIHQLDKIVALDGPLAPEAVIQRIDASLDAGHPLPETLIETAETLAFEANGTEIGAELTRVYLRGLAHTGEVLLALHQTDASVAARQMDNKTAKALRLEILGLALDTPADTDFLQVALNGPLALDQSDRAMEIRRGIATRLIDLGLGENARQVLSETAGVPEPEDRKIFARSFVEENRPEMAIGYLAGLVDEESAVLRARSHSLAGEYARAATVFAKLGDADSTARAIWRAEDWAQAAESGTEAEQAAAMLTYQPGIDGSSIPGPLARDRALLNRSKDTRQRLAELLDTTGIP